MGGVFKNAKHPFDEAVLGDCGGCALVRHRLSWVRWEINLCFILSLSTQSSSGESALRITAETASGNGSFRDRVSRSGDGELIAEVTVFIRILLKLPHLLNLLAYVCVLAIIKFFYAPFIVLLMLWQTSFYRFARHSSVVFLDLPPRFCDFYLPRINCSEAYTFIPPNALCFRVFRVLKILFWPFFVAACHKTNSNYGNFWEFARPCFF